MEGYTSAQTWYFDCATEFLAAILAAICSDDSKAVLRSNQFIEIKRGDERIVKGHGPPATTKFQCDDF